MEEKITITIGYPPPGIPIEWFRLDSHLGRPKKYAFDHPYTLSVPIFDGATKAWITLNSDMMAAVQLDSAIQVGNELVLTFGWYCAEWSIGVSFGY
jgi:hypothetical protein